MGVVSKDATSQYETLRFTALVISVILQQRYFHILICYFINQQYINILTVYVNFIEPNVRSIRIINIGTYEYNRLARF